MIGMACCAAICILVVTAPQACVGLRKLVGRSSWELYMLQSAFRKFHLGLCGVVYGGRSVLIVIGKWSLLFVSGCGVQCKRGASAVVQTVKSMWLYVSIEER